MRVATSVKFVLHRPLAYGALHNLGGQMSCMWHASDMVFAKCRAPYWFWDRMVLWQTLMLTVAQVLATFLNAYFQLTIMLMVLVMDLSVLAVLAVLAHLHPYRAPQCRQGTCCDTH